nr:PREDICTED: uncharacterized protein LOC107398933 [Tribolium castaneum]|eukprot:XP_015840002.1 PREDICTED: uncharacterized protein LOC107398933 [Tribolium castaneum]
MPGKRVSPLPLKKSSSKRFKTPGDGCSDEEISASQLTSLPPSSSSSLSNLSPAATQPPLPPPPPSQPAGLDVGVTTVSKKGIKQTASPASPEPTHTEADMITPAEWSDPVLEQSMIEMANNFENDESERTARMIVNEKFCLIHEVVYPITKSGSRLLSIGVKPLHDYAPLLKIHNPEVTSAITVSIDTFEDFLKEKVSWCVC